MTQSEATRQSWKPVVGVAVGLSLLASLMLLAFGLPAVNSGPNDVPIAVVAPEAVANQVTGALDEARPGAFEWLLRHPRPRPVR